MEQSRIHLEERKVAACVAVQQNVTENSRGFVAEILSDFREARNIASSMRNRQGSGHIAMCIGWKESRETNLETFKGDRDRERERDRKRGKSNLF